MTTEQLLYLQEIFHEGSLSGAARNLGLSQSTLSKSLQSLETELGVSLFVRIRGRLLPTKQGYAALDMAQKVCGLQKQLTERIQSLRSDSGTLFSIGFPLCWTYETLPLILREFHRLCPTCAVLPVEYSAKNLRQMLEAGDLSLALAPGEAELGTGFRCLPLGTMEILLALPPEYGGSKTAECGSCSGPYPVAKLSHFQNLPLILPDSHSVLSLPTNRYFQQISFSPEILFQSPNPSCRLAAVKAGLGATLIATSAAVLAEGTALFSLSPAFFVPICLVFPDQFPVPPELNLFVQLFKDRFRAQKKHLDTAGSFPPQEVLL